MGADFLRRLGLNFSADGVSIGQLTVGAVSALSFAGPAPLSRFEECRI